MSVAYKYRVRRIENIKLAAFITKCSGWIWTVVRAVLLIGLCFMILYPLIVKFTSSIMHVDDMYDASVRFVPRRTTLQQYRIAWEWMNYPRVLLNTTTLTLVVSLLQLASCTIVGYGLGRFDFKGRNIVFGLVLLTLVVPPEMVMIPLFLNFRFFDLFGLIPEPGINLLGSYWPFVLTSCTSMGLKNGLFIYIMTHFFRGMPHSLEEAAEIDGASSFQTFYKIMLPGAKPAMIIVFLFSFVWQWNDRFYTDLFLRNSESYFSYALQTFAARFSSNSPIRRQFPYHYGSLLNNAGMMMFMAPLLVLYLFMQRHFVESIERTGLVG
ncbi:MAG: carbohydrate ABC transporter permease [Bacillota bacterium]